MVSTIFNESLRIHMKLIRDLSRDEGVVAERARIAAMACNCPEPIINEMMEVRAKEVAGFHMADQVRRMLLVFANAIERGEHGLLEPSRREDGDAI